MIKKCSLFLLLVVTFLSTSIVAADLKIDLPIKEAQAVLAYQKNSDQFQHVSVKTIQVMMLEGKNFYLYTGRATCPHCRNFIPKLLQAAKHCKTPIYYLDSENTNLNVALSHFRTHYGIRTVPNLSQFQSNQLIKSLDKPSQAQNEEISHFLLQ